MSSTSTETSTGRVEERVVIHRDGPARSSRESPGQRRFLRTQQYVANPLESEFKSPLAHHQVAVNLLVEAPRQLPREPEPHLPGLLVEGGHGDDRPGRRVGAEGAGERLAGEVEDAAVLTDHEVAVAEADHAGDGLVEPGA